MYFFNKHFFIINAQHIYLFYNYFSTDTLDNNVIQNFDEFESYEKHAADPTNLIR